MEENKQKFRELERLISKLRKMFDVAKGTQITEIKKITETFFDKLAKVLESGLGPQTLNAAIPSNINAIWRAFNEIKRIYIDGDPSRDQDSKIDRLSEILDEKFNEIKDMIETIEFKIDEEKNNPVKTVTAIRDFYESESGRDDETDVQVINEEFAKQLKRNIIASMKEDLLRKVNSDFYGIDPKRRDIIRKGIMEAVESDELSQRIARVFRTKNVVRIEDLGDLPLDISDQGMERNVLTGYRSYCKARGIDLDELLREQQENNNNKKKESDFKTFQEEINGAVNRENNKGKDNRGEQPMLDSHVIE